MTTGRDLRTAMLARRKDLQVECLTSPQPPHVPTSGRGDAPTPAKAPRTRRRRPDLSPLQRETVDVLVRVVRLARGLCPAHGAPLLLSFNHYGTVVCTRRDCGFNLVVRRGHPLWPYVIMSIETGQATLVVEPIDTKLFELLQLIRRITCACNAVVGELRRDGDEELAVGDEEFTSRAPA